MSARDHIPDLTIDIPAALPAPTRFERVIGERVDAGDRHRAPVGDEVEFDFAITTPPPRAPTAPAHTPRRSRNTAAPPLDDEFVDQFSGLVHRRLYLRLARTGAFPSKRVGQKLVARWGDVRRALAPEDRRVDEDPFDRLRRQIGLVPRGGP